MLAITEHVETPAGPRQVRDFCAGDALCHSNGGVANAISAGDVTYEECVKVTFNDGVHLVCTADQTLPLLTHKRRKESRAPRATTLATVMDRGVRTVRDSSRRADFNWYIPLPQALIAATSALPLAPYTMGALLANGCFANDVVDLSTNDEWIAKTIISLEVNVRIHESTRRTSTCRKWAFSKLHPILRELGLDRLKSRAKFVPAEYLYADAEQRGALLAGLMDGDGSCGVRRRASYASSSQLLARDVASLVRSLGGVARVDHIPRGDFEVTIWTPSNPFSLPRKALRYDPKPWFRAIASIAPVGRLPVRSLATHSYDFVRAGGIICLT